MYNLSLNTHQYSSNFVAATKTSHKGREFICRFEKFMPEIYICPAGFRTIGYGHVLKKHENYSYINKTKALELMANDLKEAEKSVIRNIKIALNQFEFDALVSLAFNIGGAALQRSTLKQKINNFENEEIEYQFKRWVFAGGRKLAGLQRRRALEAELFLNYEYNL